MEYSWINKTAMQQIAPAPAPAPAPMRPNRAIPLKTRTISTVLPVILDIVVHPHPIAKALARQVSPRANHLALRQAKSRAHLPAQRTHMRFMMNMLNVIGVIGGSRFCIGVGFGAR